MNKNAQLRLQANKSLANALTRVRRAGQNIVAVEELAAQGKANSDLITIEFTSTDAVNTFDLIFGTPLGIAGEYLAIPFQSTFANIMFDGLAVLSDEGGVGIPFLQAINKRVVRNQMYLSHIDVITPNNVLGNSQKSESVRRFVIPYNSQTDSVAVQGAFIPQYTEYTAVSIVDTGILVGEFSGFSYKIRPLSTFKMNMHIVAINAPTFMYHTY